MSKLISDDNGRAFNKSYCNGKNRVFQSAMAGIDGKFNLTVKGAPDDLWVEIKGQNFLLGDLAIRQKKDAAIQDRDPNKTNQQNIIQTLTACSLYANREDVVLLCNVPARDYSAQKEVLERAFLGEHEVIHKAGDTAGKMVRFNIRECHALPEGECAYFGTVYNSNLDLVREDIFNAATLVLDAGDLTCNYISMNPGGEPYDEGSGSLNLGMFNSYAALQTWLMQKQVEISQAELIRHIIFSGSQPIYTGNVKVDYYTELLRQYAELELKIYNQLNSLLKLNRYRFIILAGGGAKSLRPFFAERYKNMDIVCNPGAQLLNCYGADIIYRLAG